MAEIKQEKRTFKWGDNEYLLDDLLKIHAEQENNYYNFARDRGKYDEEALKGLRQAVTNRINAVKSGQTFEGDGVLQGDQVDNTKIQTQKKGLFKKDKYVEQDNTEWAKYYLNKLVGQLKPHQENTDKGTWDVNKHGLGAYLTGQGLNAQDVFEKYDLQDPNNTTAARSFTQRRDLLKKHLTGYKDWLTSKGFDFSKNDNEWDDTFSTDFDKFVQDYDSLDNNSITAALRKFGAGDFTDAFTSDRWEINKSAKQSQAEAQAASNKKKQEDEAKLKGERLKEWEDFAYSQKRTSTPVYYRPFDYSTHDFNGKETNFMNWYGDLNNNQKTNYGTYLGRDVSKWSNAWSNYTSALRSGQAYDDGHVGVLLQGTFESQPNGFIDLGDGKYLIRDSVTDQGQGTVYDPKSGYTNTVFLGDIAGKNSEIKDIYKQLAYKYINNKYGTTYEDRSYVFKEGGNLIPKHQYGNEVVYNWESTDSSIKPKAERNKMSLEQQKNRDKYISSSNKSEDNPNAGFSAAEVTRLITIGADIGSLFLDPISGTAVGLASSAGNFVADIMDDGFQWEDVKNLGINVGFDLVGAIPIFGDAVGTGSKLVKNLLKFGPRMMAGLAAYQGVKNFDGMMGSWEKMMSSDEDAKMTVQDWRNIAQSISLVTGAGRAIKNKAAQNAMKNKARVDDVVGINIYDKSTKQTRQILVDGETAKNIKAAQGDRTKVEAELSKLEDFKDKFGESGTLEVLTKGRGPLQSPIHRVDKNGSKSFELRPMRGEGRAQVTDIYDFSRVPEGYGSYGGYQPKWGERLSKWHRSQMEQVNKRNNPPQESHKGAKTAYDAEIERLMGPVNDQVTAVQAAMTRRTQGLDQLQRQTSRTVSDIQALQKRLKGVKETDVQAELAGFNKATSGLQTLVTKHKHMTQQLNNLAQQLDVVKQKIAVEKSMNRKTSHLEQQQAQIESQLQTGQTTLTTMETRIAELQAKGAARSSKEPQLKQTLRDFEQLHVLERRLNNLKESSKTAATTNHTSAYNKLQQMVQDLQTNHAKVEGRDVTWDLNKILKDAGVQNAFKQGGSINRNKINKFLNYAKG